ncbi:MAG TPA: cyanophycin synthetase, partial [Myxococcota bacterium]|nr:cyanophycin synthetase [Myxococcota bacterium]
GEPRHIAVIDDFAHHPTAVELTIESLRLRFGQRRLWVIFEPRSNTSRRKVFQDRYAEVFGGADVVIIPTPPDQERIAAHERFDADALVQKLRAKGIEAFHLPTVDEIVAVVAANALPWDVVAVFSNGGFGGIPQKLLKALAVSP